jgi:alkyldihydroxyacetonephosphate synthase
MNESLLSSLRAELGSLIVVDPEVLRARRFDYWAVSHLRDWRGQPIEEPGCVCQPATTAEVQSLVRWAVAHRVPVVPFGLGSGVCGGILPTADVLMIDVSRMSATREISDVDLLATFEAGRNGLDAEEEVAARGLTIGHWPQSIAVSSVGGWVSTRASGQFSTAYGNIEDIVYSIEAVLPNGELVTLGKAPRASAGPDLRHLLMGGEGTMGIVTAVTFSLRAAPEIRRYTAFHAADFDQGLEAQRLIVRADWRPPVMRLYDPVETKRNFPAHTREQSPLLIMVHEGPVTRVNAEIAEITAIATAAGLSPADPAAVDQWMERRNHVNPWTDFYERGIVVDTIEISAPWSKIGAVYSAAVADLWAVTGVIAASAHSSHVYRSGINLYFTFVAAVAPEEMEATYFECWRRVMEATARHGGGIAHHHGAGRLRKPYLVHDLGTTGVELLRTIQHAVDPAGIMNPGNLVPD